MYPNQQKVPNAGSIYINYKKGTDDGVIAAIDKCVQYLANNGVFLSVSIKEGNGYKKLTGFFNKFKKTEKQPDIVLKEPSFGAVSKPKVASNDDLPF